VGQELQLLQPQVVDEAVQGIQMGLLALVKTVGLVVVVVSIKMLQLMALTDQVHLDRVTMVALVSPIMPHFVLAAGAAVLALLVQTRQGLGVVQEQQEMVDQVQPIQLQVVL
jgi:hypothetical protein